MLAGMGKIGIAAAAGTLLMNRDGVVEAGVGNDLFSLDSAADIPGLDLTPLADGQHISIRGYHPGTDIGGGIFYVDKTRAKSGHNGGTVFSPTVPWDGTQPGLSGYLSGTGETAPAGSGCLVRLTGDMVTPEMFGARKNGSTDDTASLQKAVDFAAGKGGSVLLADGVFSITKFRIKNGLACLGGDAELRASARVGEAIIELDGPLFGGTAVIGCTIEGLRLNANMQARRGIFASGPIKCLLTGNRIYNLYASNTVESCGIRLHHGSLGNQVTDNIIESLVDGTNGVFSSATGIQLTGNSSSVYGGFENGAFTVPTMPCNENIITGNRVENGTHGITLGGASYNLIANNLCKGQSHRNIIMSPISSNNVVSGNQCLNFGSSGIHMAYGSNFNTITGNQCRSSNASGEAGIQMYVGTTNNTVTGNEIMCGSNYGIYTAIESSSHSIKANRIGAQSNKRAAIAVESDWKQPLPAGAAYSRPNYGPPPSPRTQWGIAPTGHMDISDNTIVDPAPGIAAICVGQLGSTEAVGVTIRNNAIVGTEPAHYWHFFEETAGQSRVHKFSGNAAGVKTAKTFYANGRAHFELFTGNVPGDASAEYAPPAGTVQPSAAFSDFINLSLYSTATSVTDFPGGMNGQELRVRLSTSVTIVHDTGKIRLKGGTNVTGVSSDHCLCLKRIAGIWFELSRSF
jgi:parallel beta-helix repeat protein